MNNKFHKYHIIEIRPWPLWCSIGIFSLTRSLIVFMQFKRSLYFFLSIISLIFMSYSWWRDVIRESLLQGYHHSVVIDGLKLGIILFITSEVFFFVSFFWGYFHRRISPNIEIGQIWPPFSIISFNPINVPLLNTIILLSSGVRVTWSHHAILGNLLKKANFSLLLTIILGLYFSLLQGMEYYQAEFCLSDSIYGSSFFIATGFHGLHVIIGSTFLLICYIRIKNYQISSNHLIGFEAAAWYWHFVDVVWLFLYISIYWWGK